MADTHVDAMSDLIAAVKAGDPKKASLAFRRAYEACAEGDDEDEPTSSKPKDEAEEY